MTPSRSRFASSAVLRRSSLLGFFALTFGASARSSKPPKASRVIPSGRSSARSHPSGHDRRHGHNLGARHEPRDFGGILGAGGVVVRPYDDRAAMQRRPVGLGRGHGAEGARHTNMVGEDLAGGVGGLFAFNNKNRNVGALGKPVEPIERPRASESPSTRERLSFRRR